MFATQDYLRGVIDYFCTCSNNSQHEEGIKWSKRAIATKEGQPYSTHSARAHLLLGIGLYLRSTHSTQHLTRNSLTDRAIDALQK
jgi:hypothetical protein